MKEFTEAITHNKAKRDHLFAKLNEEMLEKALTTEEFNEQFGETHDVYLAKGLGSYVADRIKNEGESDELVKSITAEFEALTPVLVKSGTAESPILSKVYVSKKAENPATEEEEK